MRFDKGFFLGGGSIFWLYREHQRTKSQAAPVWWIGLVVSGFEPLVLVE